MNILLQTIFDYIFPHTCCHCHANRTIFCDDCYEQLQFLFSTPTPQLTPCYLDSLTSAVLFTEVARSLIYTMKYYPVKEVASWCGNLLNYTLVIPAATYITSIPLHPSKLALRGFNQAAQIATSLSAHTHIPYQEMLSKQKATAPQAHILNRDQRKQNMHAQFKPLSNLIRPPPTVILIDDVYTTGATLNEAARVLKEVGVSVVHGITVAHGM